MRQSNFFGLPLLLIEKVSWQACRTLIHRLIFLFFARRLLGTSGIRLPALLTRLQLVNTVSVLLRIYMSCPDFLLHFCVANQTLDVTVWFLFGDQRVEAHLNEEVISLSIGRI